MSEPASGVPAEDDRESRVDIAVAEYLRAAQDSAPFDEVNWMAQHADLAAELSDFLDAAAVLGTMDIAPGLGPVGMEAGLPSQMAGPPARSLADDFELLDEIGRGGMGVVYRARQISLGRDVALKMLLAARLATEREVEQFRQEAEVIAGLEHPNVVPVYAVGAWPDAGSGPARPFFAMKLMAGGSLADLPGPVAGNCHERARITATVARAVHHAHRRGVLHQDLKPSNILLDSDGEPHVTDFGLSRRIHGEPGRFASGTAVGTPGYMAPEQARGDRGLSVGADVYGLGGVLYYLLTGVPPFSAASIPETLLLILVAEPIAPRQLCKEVPRDLETICLKCLEKDPARRYASAEAFADDLERWLRGEPIAARHAGRLERLAKWARRKPGWAAAVAVGGFAIALLVAGSVFAGFLFKGERDAAMINETRAVAAERETRGMLFDALRSVPGEVRGARLRGERGAYFDGLRKLRATLAQARELGAPPDIAHAVRNEMLNLLTVRDVAIDQEWKWGASMTAVDVDPASGLYTALGADGTLTVATAGGKTFATVPVGPSSVFRFTPDGRKLMSYPADRERRLTCWAIGDGPPRALWTWPAANDAAFTPDGRWAVVGGTADGTGDTVVLDAENGRQVRRFSGYGLCRGLPVHPSRPWIAISRDDGLVRAVNYLTGEQVAEISRVGCTGGDRAENGVCWHPTRPVLAVPDADFRIHLVDVTVGQDVLPPLEGHATGGVAIRFDRDGGRLVSWDWSGTVHVWDLATGYQTCRTPFDRTAVAWFDAAGDVLVHQAAGRNGARVLRMRPGEGLRVAVDRPGPDRSSYPGPAFTSPDGRLLVAYQQKGPRHEMVRFGDAATGAELAALGDRTKPVGFERATGALITTRPGPGFERWPVVALPGGRVRVGPPESVVPHPGFGIMAGMSPDGRILVRPRPNSAVGCEIFHLGAPIRRVLTAPQADVRAAAVSPDGRWVVTGSHAAGGDVRIHEADTGRFVAKVFDDAGRGRFSPDGAWLAVAGSRLAGQLVRAGTWADHFPLGGFSEFAPDSRLIAVGDAIGVVRLLACETGREVARLEVSEPTLLIPVAFSPDGGRLYAVGQDAHALHLWMWDIRHLRARLKEMDADWDWPDLPPAVPVEPVTAVEIIRSAP